MGVCVCVCVERNEYEAEVVKLALRQGAFFFFF